MKIIFKEKLALILILIGLMPLVASGLFQLYLFPSYLEDKTFDNLKETSNIVSFEIEKFIDQSLSNIETISKNETLISKEASDSEKLKEANKINEYYSFFFQSVSILDENKQAIVSTSERLEEEWVKNEWVAKAREEKNTVISDMYIASNETNPRMVFITPVLGENREIKYFIIGQVNTSSFFKSLSHDIGQRGGIILINEYGNILSHIYRHLIFEKMPKAYPLERILIKKEGHIYFNFLEERQMGGFKTIENENFDFKWHLMTYQPEQEALGVLVDIRRTVLSLSLFFLALIFIISLFFSRKISEPIKKLSTISKEISKGNFNAKLNIYSKDEFGELAEIFNKMIEDLKKSQEKTEEEKQVLEIKVQARTRELENMNRELEEKVKERTKEMEDKLKELEKINKLMVGRELKMAELKKKIKKYENLKEEKDDNRSDK